MASDDTKQTPKQDWPSDKSHRRYRPPGLGCSPREMCRALGCKSREKVANPVPFCKKHRAEYEQMMAAPASQRHLFSTWV